MRARPTSPIAAVLIMAAVLAAPARAQSRRQFSPPPPPPPEEPILEPVNQEPVNLEPVKTSPSPVAESDESKDDGVVQLSAYSVPLAFEVYNDKGARVTVQASDLVITDNRKPVVIDSVSSRDNPANIVLMLDYSGSVAQQRMSTIARAAEALIERLRPNQTMEIVVFDGASRRALGKFTSDKAVLRAALQNISPAANGTSLHEALLAQATQTFRGKEGETNAIVVVSDFEDTSSGITREFAGNALAETGVPIYSMALPNDEGRVDEETAKTYSDLTGGQARRVGMTYDDLRRGFEEVILNISSRQVANFAPEGDEDNAYHRLNISLTEDAKRRYPGFRVRGRKGYYYGSKPAIPLSEVTSGVALADEAPAKTLAQASAHTQIQALALELATLEGAWSPAKKIKLPAGSQGFFVQSPDGSKASKLTTAPDPSRPFCRVFTRGATAESDLELDPKRGWDVNDTRDIAKGAWDLSKLFDIRIPAERAGHEPWGASLRVTLRNEAGQELLAQCTPGLWKYLDKSSPALFRSLLAPLFKQSDGSQARVAPGRSSLDSEMSATLRGLQSITRPPVTGCRVPSENL